jgi:hypothetical protein
MLTFKASPITLANGTQFIAANFSDKVNKAIAKAIADGDISRTGLEQELEDDGSGNMIPVDSSYYITDIATFEGFLVATDKDYAAVVQQTTQLNTSDSQVWLVSEKDKYKLLTIADDVRLTAKVLRYHVSFSGTQVVGVSLSFQAVIGKELVNGTALISGSYIQGITKKDINAANLLNWADENLKDKIVALKSRTATKGLTAYFKDQSRLNDSEKKAFSKISDKSSIYKNDKGQIGFVHRVSNTSYTFVAVASTTEEQQHTTMVNSLSALQIKVVEKEQMSAVDLRNRDEENRIDADSIEHHLATAKRLFDKNLINNEQYTKRVDDLLTKFGLN